MADPRISAETEPGKKGISMHYHVARNGQVYGPYTMEDLQRYVASGHVLPTDSVKSDEMSDWVPVAQFLPGTGEGGSAGFSSATAGGGAPPFTPGAPPAYRPVGFGDPAALGAVSQIPGPPDLNWGLVLLFDVLTCSLFQLIWNLILAAWFRRVYPPTKVLVLYIAAAVLIVLQGAFGQSLGLVAHHHGMNVGHTRGLIGYGFIGVACWVVRLIARFTFKAELERHYNTVEPIGLVINPVLTFFFGGIYLQSVMNRINQIKRGVAFGAYPR